MISPRLRAVTEFFPGYAFAKPHQHYLDMQERIRGGQTPDHELMPFLAGIARGLQAVLQNQQSVLESLAALHRKENAEMTDLSNLTSDVDTLVAAAQSAGSLLDELKTDVDNLTAGEVSQDQIDAIDAKIKGAQAALATAVTNDTPVAPAPPVTPVDTTGTGDGSAPAPSDGSDASVTPDAVTGTTSTS